MEYTVEQNIKWFDLSDFNESGEFAEKKKPQNVTRINVKCYIHQKKKKKN